MSRYTVAVILLPVYAVATTLRIQVIARGDGGWLDGVFLTADVALVVWALAYLLRARKSIRTSSTDTETKEQ